MPKWINGLLVAAMDFAAWWKDEAIGIYRGALFEVGPDGWKFSTTRGFLWALFIHIMGVLTGILPYVPIELGDEIIDRAFEVFGVTLPNGPIDAQEFALFLAIFAAEFGKKIRGVEAFAAIRGAKG